ncbi:MAG TPA: hypothetical protein ENG69_04220 [Candidatus Korarchaeota archaeon]|nr:hypothetical protein [Candidatus Korarchaeota archaeon]
MSQVDIIDRVTSLFDEWGVKYSVTEDNVVLSGWEVGGGEYTVVIRAADQWLWMRANIAQLSDFPEGLRAELLAELLRTHSKMNEVKYELTDDGTIGTSQEIPVEGFNPHIFQAEFGALILAIEYFVERIAPKYLGE